MTAPTVRRGKPPAVVPDVIRRYSSGCGVWTASSGPLPGAAPVGGGAQGAGRLVRLEIHDRRLGRRPAAGVGGANRVARYTPMSVLAYTVVGFVWVDHLTTEAGTSTVASRPVANPALVLVATTRGLFSRPAARGPG